MSESDLTDAEKIERLWGKLDLLRGENESLKVAVADLEGKLDAREAEVDRARAEAQGYASQLSQMALELNAARQAAANAVREYVAATEV